MFRTFLVTTAASACLAAIFLSCGNPTSSTSQGENPTAPGGATVVFSEGFGGNLSKWEPNYMILAGEPTYPQMRITTDVAHAGQHSLTTDSNQTALIYNLSDTTRIDHGIAGVQFYIYAKGKGEINFTVEIGKNAGSSGGLGKAFGIGFDPNDSIKCKYYDMMGDPIVSDSMIAPIQLNHWYKCAVEVDLAGHKIAYYIDDSKVLSKALPTTDMGFIDRLLVFRGAQVDRPDYGVAPCLEGKKQYYVDDIVLYTK